MDDKRESRQKQNRITIGITIVLIGFTGTFICTVIWWSRIHPWFSHGKKDGKKVYQLLFACWILSIAGIALSTFLLISNLCISRIYEKIATNCALLSIYASLLSAISVGSIITGAYAASYALKNPKTNDDLNNNKCMKYIGYGITESLAWAVKNGKTSDYTKWETDLIKKARKDNGNYSGYLCVDMGASTLTFVIVQCVGILYWIYYFIKAICLAGIYG